jgi:hypothetical protein
MTMTVAWRSATMLAAEPKLVDDPLGLSTKPRDPVLFRLKLSGVFVRVCISNWVMSYM